MDHAARTEFIRDVRSGLGKGSQKELPSSYLYDEIGAALFEAITLLPEYGLTRADARLLELHSAELASKLPASLVVGELGSGSGKKTRWILEALAARRALQGLNDDFFDLGITHLAGCPWSWFVIEPFQPSFQESETPLADHAQ